jgi:uncharacterized protein YciI
MTDDAPTTTSLAAPSIESIWFVEATYAPDAAETRTPFRAEHLAGVAARRAAGTYIEAGAFGDVSASIVLVRADSEEAALAIVRDDVYLRNGIWVELRARPFGRVVVPGLDEPR